jgi:hypothetical protein
LVPNEYRDGPEAGGSTFQPDSAVQAYIQDQLAKRRAGGYRNPKNFINLSFG